LVMFDQPAPSVKGLGPLVCEVCRSLLGRTGARRGHLHGGTGECGLYRGGVSSWDSRRWKSMEVDGRRPVTGVYLETGTKRVFACAVDWPGWCRSGRGEEQALAALATAASRYAVVPALASVTFDPVHEVDCIEIAERVTGTSATDFGA